MNQSPQNDEQVLTSPLGTSFPCLLLRSWRQLSPHSSSLSAAGAPSSCLLLQINKTRTSILYSIPQYIHSHDTPPASLQMQSFVSYGYYGPSAESGSRASSHPSVLVHPSRFRATRPLSDMRNVRTPLACHSCNWSGGLGMSIAVLMLMCLAMFIFGTNGLTVDRWKWGLCVSWLAAFLLFL